MEFDTILSHFSTFLSGSVAALGGDFPPTQRISRKTVYWQSGIPVLSGISRGFKRRDIGASGFEDILKELPPQFDCVRPLCRELRKIFFPIYEDNIFSGTPGDPEKMYEPIWQGNS